MLALDGAYKRVYRAGIHLTNLNRRVNILCTRIRDNTILKTNPKSYILKDGRRIGYHLGSTLFHIEPVPQIVQILVGEITYNLRAALDYLVFELARLDSKEIKNGTQFPIEDEKKSFISRRNTFLKGVNDKHVAAIEMLQPYSGCEWTGILRELSNPDKHRQLTIANSLVGISIPVSSIRGATKAKIKDQTVNIKPHLSTGIQFRTGQTIITVQKLKQLKLQVTQTLDAFKSEFE